MSWNEQSRRGVPQSASQPAPPPLKAAPCVPPLAAPADAALGALGAVLPDLLQNIDADRAEELKRIIARKAGGEFVLKKRKTFFASPKLLFKNQNDLHINIKSLVHF